MAFAPQPAEKVKAALKSDYDLDVTYTTIGEATGRPNPRTVRKDTPIMMLVSDIAEKLGAPKKPAKPAPRSSKSKSFGPRKLTDKDQRVLDEVVEWARDRRKNGDQHFDAPDTVEQRGGSRVQLTFPGGASLFMDGMEFVIARESGRGYDVPMSFEEKQRQAVRLRGLSICTGGCEVCGNDIGRTSGPDIGWVNNLLDGKLPRRGDYRYPSKSHNQKYFDLRFTELICSLWEEEYTALVVAESAADSSIDLDEALQEKVEVVRQRATKIFKREVSEVEVLESLQRIRAYIKSSAGRS